MSMSTAFEYSLVVIVQPVMIASMTKEYDLKISFDEICGLIPLIEGSDFLSGLYEKLTDIYYDSEEEDTSKDT
jgi:hypothetical protein